MRRLMRYLIPGLLLLTLLLAGCGGGNTTAASPEDSVTPAPVFSYQDGDGNTVSLSDLRGQVVLLNFWATWCPPCVYEMPFLEEAHRQLPDNAVILAVNAGESAEDVSAFVTEHNLSLPIILDSQDAIAQLYRAYQLPTTVIIDAEGVISQYKIGPFRGSDDVLASLARAAA